MAFLKMSKDRMNRSLSLVVWRYFQLVAEESIMSAECSLSGMRESRKSSSQAIVEYGSVCIWWSVECANEIWVQKIRLIF